MEYCLITVAETRTFRRKVVQLLTELENAELIAYLSMHPGAGVVIKGTGGIRKLRWSRTGRGKSGGVRVVYYFHSLHMPLYLLTVFGKNEKANLSMKDKIELSRSVKELVRLWSQRR